LEAVLFTKMFGGAPVDRIAPVARELGFDGIDLLIRDGFQVSPTEPQKIAKAVAALKDAGLTVPMATTDITDPAQAPTQAIFEACAEAGIKVVRLGYWKYDPVPGYSTLREGAQQDLEAIAAIASATGVKAAIQLHGGTIHGSGAQTAALLDGHDPAVLGAYPDPGNQVVQDGREDWRFTFDVLKPWLCCVGVKNGGWFVGELAGSGQRRWRSDWLGIADGMVPWDEVAAYLLESSYDGPLSFHSHYEVPMPQVVDQTRADLNYVRRLLGARVEVAV
jgi:sugar phosphate isomerase/epimerase